MADVEDHNNPCWLKVVQWKDSRVNQWTTDPRLDRQLLTAPAWCVVRTCKCHNRWAVTLPLPSKKRAQQALKALAKYS